MLELSCWFAVIQCEQMLAEDAHTMASSEGAEGCFTGRRGVLEGHREAVRPMPANRILQEAKRLRKVSESLDALAEESGPISDALSVLSGSVRDSATLLEVLVALKLKPASTVDSADK